MLYEAKHGSKAYEYIKGILDAEYEEYQAYMKRVEEAVGFEFEKYQGYQPDCTLNRVYEITAIWVSSERYEKLDKKVWKKVDDVKLEDGYLVEYKEGYKSWSPKSVFDEAYREVKGMSFGEVIEALKVGLAVRRKGWNGKGLFVVKKIPAHIEGDIIPKMQSLPQSAKYILMSRENPCIDYTNQMLIINPDGRADSWVPSSSDVFAEDWEVVDE